MIYLNSRKKQQTVSYPPVYQKSSASKSMQPARILTGPARPFFLFYTFCPVTERIVSCYNPPCSYSGKCLQLRFSFCKSKFYNLVSIGFDGCELEGKREESLIFLWNPNCIPQFPYNGKISYFELFYNFIWPVNNIDTAFCSSVHPNIHF